jgi:hypothetical protein
MREVRETLSRLERGSEPEIPALIDADAGPEKRVYSGAHDSARFLARRRREAAQADPSSAPPPVNPEPDLVLGYQDDREVSAKQAATDLASYRERLAQELLQGTDLGTAAARASGQQQEVPVEQPVEQPAEQPQPEQSERTHYTKAEVESAAVQQLQDYQDRIGAILLSIRGVGVPPELAAATQNPQAWAALQSTDPQKAAQIVEYVNRRAAMAAQLETDLNQARAQQEQIQRTQFNRWADQQDSEFEAAEPEMRGTDSAHLQRAALETLKHYGLTDSQIASAWNGTPVSLRSSAAQRLILDATRWRLASEKARTAIAKPSPPPQRPGVRQDRVSASAADLNALSRKLDEAGSAQQQLRLAGRLVAERRRAQG